MRALAFTVIGPIGREAGSLIASGLTGYTTPLGFVGGAIFGAFYAPIVITGMHQTFIAVETQLLAEMATLAVPLFSQSPQCQTSHKVQLCLGVAVALKDPKSTRFEAVPSGISALLGITEPAMFGVNYAIVRLFFAAMIGSGFKRLIAFL